LPFAFFSSFFTGRAGSKRSNPSTDQNELSVHWIGYLSVFRPFVLSFFSKILVLGVGFEWKGWQVEVCGEGVGAPLCGAS